MLTSMMLLSSTLLLAAYSASEDVIYSYPAGSQPIGQLIQDQQGALYGVSILGGAKNAGFVSELTQKRGVWKGRTIHNFGGVDGANPAGALEIDPDTGVLYGTTRYGGIG